MSEFMVACTYICTTAHYIHYKICYTITYSNTIVDMLTWGYNHYMHYNNAAKKKQKIKQNQ